MEEAAAGACPDLDVLGGLSADVVSGKLDPVTDVERHVRACPRCSQVILSGLARGPAADPTKSLSAPFQPRAVLNDELKPGDSLGRYRVLEKLGEGGMGAVYAAYDDQLHRKVAVKLLLAAEPGSTARDQARLLREAQALAQLSHPNVIGVHEVGTLGDRVFMAMELVEGQSLSRWMKASAHPWKEVLRIFIAAAEGLKAAHDKGLVHRDFKPDNVLLAQDGRVRVLDFGLARAAELKEDRRELWTEQAPPTADDATTSSKSSPSISQSQSQLSAPLTQVGLIIGTLPYMAPELLHGSPANAQSDVFAFFVSLYEALYGVRPYKGRDRVSLSAPLPEHSAPRWLQRVVLKGLASNLSERYASMAEVLSALHSDPGPRRRRRLIVGAVALVVFATALVISQISEHRHRVCQNEAEALNGVWDAPVAGKLAAAFSAGGGRDGSVLFERTRRLLDAYAQDIVRMRTDACVDTRIKGHQTDSVMALRMSCLERRAGELGGLVHVFARADPAVLAHAERTAAGLVSVSTCANLAALQAAVPLPEDPSVRARVLDAERVLDRESAELNAAHTRVALEMLGPVLQTARETHYRPLEAEALTDYAIAVRAEKSSKEAQEAGVRAVEAALAGKDSHMAALAAADLVRVEEDLGSLPQARYWAGLSSALVEGMGGDLEAEIRIARNLSVALRFASPQESEALARKELALLQRVPGLAGRYREIAFRIDFAINIWAQYRFAEARELLVANLKQALSLLGPDHSSTLSTSENLGALIQSMEGPVPEAEQRVDDAVRRMPRNTSALVRFTAALIRLEQGKLREALPVMEEITAERRAALGDNGVSLEFFQRITALARYQLGLTDAAERDARASVALSSVEDSVHSDDFSLDEAMLGTILQARGDRRGAQECFEKGLAQIIKVKGDHAPDAAEARTALAGFHLRDGHPEQALPLLERALQDQEFMGRKHRLVADTLSTLGETQLALRRSREAEQNLKDALGVYEQGHFGPEAVAPVRFALGRALAANGDAASGRAQARQARAEVQRSESVVLKALLGKIDAFLER